MKSKFLFLLIILSGLFAGSDSHASAFHHPDLNLTYVLPFVGMLLSIAVLPLISPHFWEKNYGKIAVMWAVAFYFPFLLIDGNVGFAFHELFKVLSTEYMPFIILLFSLYTISGGILLRGSLVGTPKVNVTILAIGTVLASLMGTTGAAMLLIRPMLRANKMRKHKVHSVVFFIFLVANIGGSLTPLGDPPLFLGFLKGINFFWTTTHMFLPMLTISIILLIAYYFLDSYFYRKEEVRIDEEKNKEKLKLEGSWNFILIGGVIFAVLLSGMEVFKFPIFHILGVDLIKGNLIRDLFLILMALISLMFTNKEFRHINGFTWHPILEVAKLFIGIFITIIPAIIILQSNQEFFSGMGHSLYFWLTGGLSSFLDNAPTYLVFFQASGISPDVINGVTDIGIGETAVMVKNLLAVSVGAVFMGANTYIGNAPNFMVKSIAEENGVKMPSFFGYMAWSLLILVPCFIIIDLIFI